MYEKYKQYYESETPMEISTHMNQLKFFPEAGKLQVSRPPWTDKDGNQKQGKTVTLDLNALEDCNPDEALIVGKLARQMLDSLSHPYET